VLSDEVWETEFVPIFDTDDGLIESGVHLENATVIVDLQRQLSESRERCRLVVDMVQSVNDSNRFGWLLALILLAAYFFEVPVSLAEIARAITIFVVGA
jgi:hypothetical protein